MDTATQYRAAAKAARAENDNNALAHALRHLSDIDRLAGRTDSALAQAEKAVALYGAMKPVPALELANAIRLMALAQEALGQDGRASWRRASILYAEEGITAGVQECARHLGRS